jgi:DNA-binding transcriptional regulator YhcF (GntR family)
VRARLLTALHVGRLRPGDRVPSVRQLASQTGINHKTVHRAYTALAQEGVLEVKPGSGTFVTERRTVRGESPPTPGLMGAIDRCRNEAATLGLAPAVLSRFLDICLGDGLRGMPVGLVECNWEQITMIGQDLRRVLGVQVKPILLDQLEQDAKGACSSVGCAVTTDCHWTHVAEVLEPQGLPTYTVTLDSRFPLQILEGAADSPLMVVIHDPRFGRVFGQLLDELAADRSVLDRIHFVSQRRALEVMRSAPAGTRIYLSPLVDPEVSRRVPQHLVRVDEDWHVEPRALEWLRAGLALDQAVRAGSH